MKYDRLTYREKEQFSMSINLLLSSNFMLRDIYSDQEGATKMNRDYSFVERHQDLVREYLDFSGWNLDIDSRYGVAWVSNRYEITKEKFNKQTTVFLLLLRLIYDEAREELSLKREIVTTVGEITRKMLTIGAYPKKPSDQDISKSLHLLARYNVIDKLGGRWADAETRLMIYPTVLFLMSETKVRELEDLINLKEEEIDETI
jgi:hypothetical protein